MGEVGGAYSDLLGLGIGEGTDTRSSDQGFWTGV